MIDERMQYYPEKSLKNLKLLQYTTCQNNTAAKMKLTLFIGRYGDLKVGGHITLLCCGVLHKHVIC